MVACEIGGYSLVNLNDNGSPLLFFICRSLGEGGFANVPCCFTFFCG